MKRLLAVVLGVVFGLGSSVLHAQDAIEWISMQELEARMAKEPKKVMIDLYTKWCGPCKMMDKNTFTDPKVIKLVNDHFYAVKFNAEGPDEITFNGKTYRNPTYDPNRTGRNGTHEFSMNAAVNGRVAYPTLLFYDEELTYLSPVQGYQDPGKLQKLLHFVGTARYKNQSYQEYLQEVQQANQPKTGAPRQGQGVINWMTWDEAVAAYQQQPKNIFVDVYTDWCGWCKKMDATTFRDKAVADYMNQYYYAVKFDAEMSDTIRFDNKVYHQPPVNPGSRRKPPHDFAKLLLNGKMSYPSLVIFGDDFQKAQTLQTYLNAEQMEPILAYFGQQMHRKMPYEQFMKSFSPQAAQP